jgi:MFS family permease
LAEGREASRAAAGELELEAAERGLLGIRWLNRDLGWLFVLRILRSIPQGYLGIILPLYLALLGYSAVALGTLLAFSAIAAALISMLTGVLSDRFGRKALIAIISLLFAVGGVGFAFARSFFWIVTFAAIGSIGRGGALAGGAWGPFYPAVQALVAEESSDYDRTTVFGVFSFVGVMAGAIGSLMAGLPTLTRHAVGLSELETYRGLFILSGFLGVVMAFAIKPVRERRPVAAEALDAARSEPAVVPTRTLGLSRESWHLVIRFMITNSTNGLAIGMLGPFVVYWFYRRFGASSGELAGVFFIYQFGVVHSVSCGRADRADAGLGPRGRDHPDDLDGAAVRRGYGTDLRVGGHHVWSPGTVQLAVNSGASIVPDGSHRPGRADKRLGLHEFSLASHLRDWSLPCRLLHGASRARAAPGVRARDAGAEHVPVPDLLSQRVSA